LSAEPVSISYLLHISAEALSVLGDDSFEVTRGCISVSRDLGHGLMRSSAATSHRTFGMANAFKP